MIPFDIDQAEWGSRNEYADDVKLPWAVDKWVIHWGGGPAPIADGTSAEESTLRGWQRYHIDVKGWQDIAYNYAIGNLGTVYRLRGENRNGATAGDFEPDGIPENHEARAVVFIINKGQSPSAVALAAFQSMWTADPLPVIGHKDVFAEGTGGTNTACPGPDLTTWINEEGYLMPEYRTVLNVEPWEEGTYDWGIDEARVVNINDSFTDDARRVLDDGRFLALLRRYHDTLVKPVHEALWAGQANLDLAISSLSVAVARQSDAIAALTARIEALEAAPEPTGGLSFGDTVKLEDPDA